MGILIVLLFVASVILLIKLKKKVTANKLLLQTLTSIQKERDTLSSSNHEQQERIKELSKYEGIIDTEKKAKEILADAEAKASFLVAEVNTKVDKARNEAMAITEQAKRESFDLTTKASNTLEFAKKDAVIIIDQAKSKAEEMAGDAYKALEKVNDLDKAIKAMQNIIEGYGDKYIVPTYSLLDELSQEFGHTEAGDMLKKARNQSIRMTENGSGAKCDYVESNRKETAIRFVLDAFNGKVDSILSKVKKDNFGTLQQKIKDAYVIVNYNGKAFKNAEITEGYLHARLEELKWATVVQELKWLEQEEQRRIKEQMREEEKARRDFEKAIKDAQKEEELLKKLIEKAQTEVNKANEEEKAKIELRLQDLQDKLKVAEEKNQRAISMAQQTKSGNVYIISNIGSFGEDVFKIGMTRRLEPLDRVRELGDASVPFEFDVHSMIFSEDAPALERQLHKIFLRMQLNKVNPRKEFFKVTINEIKEEIEKLGLNPKWTMTADAKQYRESLALEQAMKKDATVQQEWMEAQLQLDPVVAEDFDDQNINFN